MIDVSENFKFAVINGTTNNRLRIVVFDDPQYTITNSEIVSESMKIQSSICDDTKFTFGGCIASEFEIEISKNVDLTGKYITVFLDQTAKSLLYPGAQTFPSSDTYPGGGEYTETFAIFSGEIYSCKFNKNHLTRAIIAYDRFYWKGSIDCTKWYQSWHNANKDENGCVTVGALRKAILSNFLIFEEADYPNDTVVELPADDFPVHMIDDNVTVADLLRMICEFNGCFMIFNGGGNVEYVFVNEDKYADGANTETYDFCIEFQPEDYSKGAFDGIYINSLDGGCGILPIGTNEQENFYFMDGNNLIGNGYVTGPNTVANSINTVYTDLGIKAKIEDNFNIYYTPMTLTAQTRLWVQLGDRAAVKFKYYSFDKDENGNEFTVEHTDTIYSYILSRSISGIQALHDEITAEGENMRYTEEYFDN